MRSVEQWQQQIPGALAEFARRAVDARDIDFTYGLIATGILWPLRQAVQADDNAAADMVRQAVGPHAGRVLNIVFHWSADPLAAAQGLAARAAADAELRAALDHLIARFDAIPLFAEQLATRYLPRSDAGCSTFTGQIQAALMNVGGVTNIGSLVVHLNLPTIADQRERANRAQMLTKVRNFWIKGVLEQSLHGVAMIDFAKRVAVS